MDSNTLVIGLGFVLKSDVQPKATPVDATVINNKLASIYYNDPAKVKGAEIRNPYTKTNLKPIKLEQHPLLALGAALPKGRVAILRVIILIPTR